MKPVIPFIRSPYNYDRDSASSESGLLRIVTGKQIGRAHV